MSDSLHTTNNHKPIPVAHVSLEDVDSESEDDCVVVKIKEEVPTSTEDPKSPEILKEPPNEEPEEDTSIRITFSGTGTKKPSYSQARRYPIAPGSLDLGSIAGISPAEAESVIHNITSIPIGGDDEEEEIEFTPISVQRISEPVVEEPVLEELTGLEDSEDTSIPVRLTSNSDFAADEPRLTVISEQFIHPKVEAPTRKPTTRSQPFRVLWTQEQADDEMPTSTGNWYDEAITNLDDDEEGADFFTQVFGDLLPQLTEIAREIPEEDRTERITEASQPESEYRDRVFHIVVPPRDPAASAIVNRILTDLSDQFPIHHEQFGLPPDHLPQVPTLLTPSDNSDSSIHRNFISEQHYYSPSGPLHSHAHRPPPPPPPPTSHEHDELLKKLLSMWNSAPQDNDSGLSQDELLEIIKVLSR